MTDNLLAEIARLSSDRDNWKRRAIEAEETAKVDRQLLDVADKRLKKMTEHRKVLRFALDALNERIGKLEAEVAELNECLDAEFPPLRVKS